MCTRIDRSTFDSIVSRFLDSERLIIICLRVSRPTRSIPRRSARATDPLLHGAGYARIYDLAFDRVEEGRTKIDGDPRSDRTEHAVSPARGAPSCRVAANRLTDRGVRRRLRAEEGLRRGVSSARAHTPFRSFTRASERASERLATQTRRDRVGSGRR